MELEEVLQGLLHCMENSTAVEKSHFRFGRVDVYVELGGVDLKIERYGREFPWKQALAESSEDCLLKHAVSKSATIDDLDEFARVCEAQALDPENLELKARFFVFLGKNREVLVVG
jgi:hypothetical protein